jgi:hypothetical protein
MTKPSKPTILDHLEAAFYGGLLALLLLNWLS